MKLKEFRKKMQKNIFTTAEARLVAFEENPKVLNLQLHQWKKIGDLIALKRGLYMFAGSTVDKAEIAKSLYAPCYFSLEYVLSLYGIIPEAVFQYTLVTLKATRRFETPAGTFIYRKIKREAFTGFDLKTLMGEKEKALVDYLYLKKGELVPDETFWEESRLEIGAVPVHFQKMLRYAKLFHSKKLDHVLYSFLTYAKSHQIHHRSKKKRHS